MSYAMLSYTYRWIDEDIEEVYYWIRSFIPKLNTNLSVVRDDLPSGGVNQNTLFEDASCLEVRGETSLSMRSKITNTVGNNRKIPEL